MPTLQQVYKKPRKPRRYKDKRLALKTVKRTTGRRLKHPRFATIDCPQKRGVCLKVFQITPRKPNSALRKVARVALSNRKTTGAYIPGQTHNLQKHGTVLIRGGRTKDVPGMKYTIIRGKFDLRRLELRRNGRSKFGTKLTRWKVDHRYKKFYYF